MRQASQEWMMWLIKKFHPVCNHPLADAYKQSSRKRKHVNIIVLFLDCMPGLGYWEKDVLAKFYYNATAGLATNSVKLIPLGQQDGQEILFSLQPLIHELAEKTLESDKELIVLYWFWYRVYAAWSAVPEIVYVMNFRKTIEYLLNLIELKNKGSIKSPIT